MKKMMKKVLTLALTLAIMFTTLLPRVNVSAVTTGEDYLTVEVKKNTSLKSEPYDASKSVADVKKGAYLIVTGSVKNKYSNVWLKVMLSNGDEAFIYIKHTREHSCKFKAIDGCNIRYCACGKLNSITKNRQISYAEALPANVLSPEVLTAIATAGASLKALGAAAVSASMPYLVAITIGGAIVYFFIKADATSVKIDAATSDWVKIDEKYKPQADTYYIGCVSKQAFLIDIANPLTAKEAMTYIDACLRLRNMPTHQKSSWFIYTLKKRDVENLVKAYLSSKVGINANLNTPDTHCNGNDGDIRQFAHFHIFPSGAGNSPWVDHMGSHICYGSPLCNSHNFWASTISYSPVNQGSRRGQAGGLGVA